MHISKHTYVSDTFASHTTCRQPPPKGRQHPKRRQAHARARVAKGMVPIDEHKVQPGFPGETPRQIATRMNARQSYKGHRGKLGCSLCRHPGQPYSCSKLCVRTAGPHKTGGGRFVRGYKPYRPPGEAKPSEGLESESESEEDSR